LMQLGCAPTHDWWSWAWVGVEVTGWVRVGV